VKTIKNIIYTLQDIYVIHTHNGRNPCLVLHEVTKWSILWRHRASQERVSLKPAKEVFDRYDWWLGLRSPSPNVNGVLALIGPPRDGHPMRCHGWVGMWLGEQHFRSTAACSVWMKAPGPLASQTERSYSSPHSSWSISMSARHTHGAKMWMFTAQ
jgi:hypothetical protein